MLKKISGLFLGLVVLVGSACVTPTHASSALPVAITYIQPGSSASALSEYVAVYNMSSVSVDITNWCVSNKLGTTFACVDVSTTGERQILPAYSSAVFASDKFLLDNSTAVNGLAGRIVFTNQSSGAIVASSDSITLLDADDEVVDHFSWTSAPASGKIFQRIVLASGTGTGVNVGGGVNNSAAAVLYATTGSAADWQSVKPATYPLNETIITLESSPELPPGEPSDPSSDPPSGSSPDLVSNPSGSSGDSPSSSNVDAPQSIEPVAAWFDPYITEVLPNPDGADTGNEYIEVYNPNITSVSLENYALSVGEPGKVYPFPAGAVLEAGEYKAFSNTIIKFTLLNSTSVVQLMQGSRVVGPVVRYESPASGMAWALVNSEWVYTAPSPNTLNELLWSDDVEAEEDGAASVLKPCAANQYRNPTTNRCRLIASSGASQLVPCKTGQVRDTTTNRCRSVAAAQELTPCKSGQERNPATNRCVTIKKMTDTNYAVEASAEKSKGAIAWYTWLGVVGVIMAVIAYAVWEWRVELSGLVFWMKQKFARRPN